MDLPYIALLQNSLSLHLAFPSFLTPILFSCGVIPGIIRTCANGVAEGFALQVFAEMPTRDKGGWDCFFDLASILKYLTTTSARGSEATGQQGGWDRMIRCFDDWKWIR